MLTAHTPTINNDRFRRTMQYFRPIMAQGSVTITPRLGASSEQIMRQLGFRLLAALLPVFLAGAEASGAPTAAFIDFDATPVGGLLEAKLITHRDIHIAE